MRAPASRADELAVLYERHHGNLERIVTRQVRAPGMIVEDACQTAWTRLCAHPDVTLEERGRERGMSTVAPSTPRHSVASASAAPAAP